MVLIICQARGTACPLRSRRRSAISRRRRSHCPGRKRCMAASENEGGNGLVARGVVTSAEGVAKKRGVARQTPRVSVTIRRTALAKRPLGRRELKHFIDWNEGQPATEL